LLDTSIAFYSLFWGDGGNTAHDKVEEVAMVFMKKRGKGKQSMCEAIHSLITTMNNNISLSCCPEGIQLRQNKRHIPGILFVSFSEQHVCSFPVCRVVAF